MQLRQLKKLQSSLAGRIREEEEDAIPPLVPSVGTPAQLESAGERMHEEKARKLSEVTRR